MIQCAPLKLDLRFQTDIHAKITFTASLFSLLNDSLFFRELVKRSRTASTRGVSETATASGWEAATAVIEREEVACLGTVSGRIDVSEGEAKTGPACAADTDGESTAGRRGTPVIWSSSGEPKKKKKISLWARKIYATVLEELLI